MLVALFALVLLLRLPGVPQPFDNDSGAIAYHARLINEGLPLYGEHHPGHHMPGAYYAFAAAFRLLGDGVASIKIALIPWTLLVVWLVYRTGALLFDRSTGIAAAVFCALLGSHVKLLGLTGEIELWANLPRALGVYLVVLALVGRERGWLWGLVGLTGAWALAFKAVYVTPLAVGGGVAAVEFLRHRAERGAAAVLLRRSVWMMLGLLAGAAPIVGYFAAVGLLDRFLLVFRMGQDYVAFRGHDAGWLTMLTLPILGLRRINAAVLLLGLAGFFGMLAGRLRSLHPRRPTYPLALWLFVSVLEAGVTRVSFSHYPLLVVPALSLTAAPPALAGYRRLRERLQRRAPALRTAALALVVAAVLLVGYHRNLRLMGYWVGYRAGLVDYETYLVGGWNKGADLLRVQRLADYVEAATAPEDRIYYWSGDLQLYYLSRRRCASEFIWPIEAEPTGAREQILSPATAYILVGHNRYAPVPDWLEAGLARDYVLETVIEDQRIYRRLDR